MNTIMGAIPQPGITGSRSEQIVPDSTSPTPDVKTGPKMRALKVDFFYGKFQALHDVSIDFPENHITALIGPSGCGKSTFLRTLNRINDTIRGSRVTGEVVIDGRNILQVDVTELRRRVGMVFQRPNPFPSRSSTTSPTACASTVWRTTARFTRWWSAACGARRSGRK